MAEFSLNHNHLWGLYIHVPFCRRKCGYCDFYSLASRALLPAYLKALQWEMGWYGHRIGPVDSVYLGGGTPSLLNPEHLKDLFRSLHLNFRVSQQAEVTMEANPEGLDLGYLVQLRKLGVNRLSLGMQSLDQGVLDFLGRTHKVQQGLEAVKLARRAGFENLSLDFIYGVPGQDIPKWRDMLYRMLDLNPQHLSLYQLTFEAATPLGRLQAKGLVRPYGEEEQYDFFMETSRIMREAGYLHYEVSNFARDQRYFSRHNLKYWTHRPYLGLGPSAHSFCGRRRWWNQASLKRYLQCISQRRPPVEGSEHLDREALRLEALYFGFRTSAGLDLARFKHCFGQDLTRRPPGLLKRLQEEGWVQVEGRRLLPTVQGMVRADALPLLW